jgi:hypothetical protein
MGGGGGGGKDKYSLKHYYTSTQKESARLERQHKNDPL